MLDSGLPLSSTSTTYHFPACGYGLRNTSALYFVGELGFAKLLLEEAESTPFQPSAETWNLKPPIAAPARLTIWPFMPVSPQLFETLVSPKVAVNWNCGAG